MTSITVKPSYRPPAQEPERAITRSWTPRRPWAWLALASLLLGTSGGVRFWRDHQFAALSTAQAAPAFPLHDLPRDMVNWRSSENTDSQLDPQVAQIAGSSDHIVRTYLDEKTGDQMSALVIYGLAVKVFGHVPEVCYPAAGYQLVRPPVDRELRVPGVKGPVRYRWAIYMKRIGGIGRYEESYYTFYHNGDWVSDVSDRWKSFRHHPGIYKVQLGRVVSGLSEEVDAPSEALLGAFVQEISRRTSPGAIVPAKAAVSVR